MDNNEFYKKMIEVTKENPELYEIIQAIIIIYSKMDTNQKEHNYSYLEINKKIQDNYNILDKKIDLKNKTAWYKKTKVFLSVVVILGITTFSIIAVFFGEYIDILVEHLKDLVEVWNAIE